MSPTAAARRNSTFRPGRHDGRQALTSGSHSRYLGPRWSGDGKRIAFADQTGRLFVVEVASRKKTLVARDPAELTLDYQWSPDGQYLAYSLNSVAGLSSIYLWSAADGVSRRATPEFVNSQSRPGLPMGICSIS